MPSTVQVCFVAEKNKVIMRFLFALCTLIGVTFAFVPDTEYRYKYEGRLGLGFPDIRNKYSGAGIKATVTVQVFDKSNAIFKLSDIEVGEFLGDTGIKITNHLPIEYSPLKGDAKVLEEPYEVFFDTKKNEVMVVPKSDIEWIVNIRKSIAQLFLIEPVRSNFGLSKIFTSKEHSIDAFTLYESTLFGTCSVDYAFLPVGFSTMDDKKNIEVIKNNDEHYYLLTRTVNFDKCKDAVYTQVLLAGNNNLDFKSMVAGDISSRSSVMNVKLMGKPGSFVVQEGNVNGYYSFRPFGVSTEKFMSISNQTITLQSSNKITKKFVVPTPNRTIKTLYTEMSSPFSTPSNPVPFINYYNEKDAFDSKSTIYRFFTGVHFNPEYSKKYQKLLDEAIKEAAQLTTAVEPFTLNTKNVKLETSDEVKITNLLHTAVEISFFVNIKDLEELFETYYNDKTEIGQLKSTLLIDVCATNGYTPVKFVINEMKKGRITPERITTIFSTFANSFLAIPVLKDIMTYVKTLDFSTNPVMVTNVLINFATILKTSCVVPQYKNQFDLWYGAERCDVKIITDELIPFLKQKFESSNEVYQRRAIVHTLANLGTTEAFDFVAQIATGSYDVNIREIAILGLSYPNVNETMNKDKIFDILMPIVHNIKEDPYLRQIAITVLITYKPSASWWQRLAVSTWREPSKSVGAFIYYLIKSNYDNTNPEYSEDARASHFLLPLTKPYPPSSTYFYVYGKYIPKLYSSVLFTSAVYKDDETSFPRNFHTKFVNDVGGYKFTLFETMFSTNYNSNPTSNTLDKISKVLPEELKKIMMMVEKRDAEDVLAELKKYLNPSVFMNDKSQRESNLLLQFFENLQYVLPLNSKTIPTPFNMESFDFLKMLMNGQKIRLNKFFDALSAYIFIPTDVGLPSTLSFKSPIFFSAEGKMKFLFGGKNEVNIMKMINSDSFTVELDTNIKFVSKYQMDALAYLPWNDKSIHAGVQTLKSVNLPLKLRTSFENQGAVKNVSFDIIPTFQKEFAAARVQNIPYVAINKVYPDSVAEFNKYEVISVNGEGTGLYKNKYMLDRDLTGLDAGIVYEGDAAFPFTYGNFYDILNNPYKMFSKIMSPTAKLFDASFVVNFETSATKAFHPSFSFAMPSYTDKNMILKKKTTGEHNIFVLRLRTSGNEERFFEYNFQTKVLSQDSTVKTTEYLYKYIQQYPGMKPQVFCVDIEARSPVFKDYKTLLRLLTSSNTDSTFVGKVFGGRSCTDAQFVTLKGTFKVSDDLKKVLVDDITTELNINKYSTFDRQEKSFYDRTTLLMEYKEPLPTYFTNMTYQMYDILRGSQFPFVYNNYYKVKNQKGRIFVEGERYLDGTYNLRAELPTENINYDSFKMPFMYQLNLYFFGFDLVNEFPVLGLINEFVF